MKTGTRLLILCLLAPAALAENMSLRSGRVLKDAVVVSSGDDFVNIQYTDGVAKVSYKDLTDAQQRDYRMTPDEVKARLDQRRMEEAARRKKAEEARTAADAEARKIRESLSEAERHPRYLEGADISRMFLQKLDTGGSIESQVGRVAVADGTRTRIIAGNQVYSAIQTDAVRQLQRAVYPETPCFIGVIAGAVVRNVGIHRFVGITDERSEHEPVAQAVV